MEEEWRQIAAFPDYDVSNLGRVKNTKYDRILAPSVNSHGHAKVKLMGYGRANTRQINHLVALLFLEPPSREDFISVIHLNGDKADCRVENLMWRPRFFTIRYHKQFETPMWKRTKVPVVDIATEIEYKTAQEAAMTFGLVLTELLSAAYNKRRVWPTYQQFRTLPDYF